MVQVICLKTEPLKEYVILITVMLNEHQGTEDFEVVLVLVTFLTHSVQFD